MAAGGNPTVTLAPGLLSGLALLAETDFRAYG